MSLTTFHWVYDFAVLFMNLLFILLALVFPFIHGVSRGFACFHRIPVCFIIFTLFTLFTIRNPIKKLAGWPDLAAQFLYSGTIWLLVVLAGWCLIKKTGGP